MRAMGLEVFTHKIQMLEAAYRVFVRMCSLSRGEAQKLDRRVNFAMRVSSHQVVCLRHSCMYSVTRSVVRRLVVRSVYAVRVGE